jgi:hypothetical protein
MDPREIRDQDSSRKKQTNWLHELTSKRVITLGTGFFIASGMPPIERYRFDSCSAAMALHFSKDPVRTGATATERR